MKSKVDRKKEIDAFNELKRRGLLENQEIESGNISDGFYSQRLAWIEHVNKVHSTGGSAVGKKSKAKKSTRTPSKDPAQ